MKLVIQCVSEAKCVINDDVYSSIGRGYMLLVGIEASDTKDTIYKMAEKLLKLRINKDENDKINLSIKDINGEILSISQFTLLANTKKSNRPGFENAKKGDEAKELYEYFNKIIEDNNIRIKTGVFGEDMKIHLINDGPITITLDSKEL